MAISKHTSSFYRDGTTTLLCYACAGLLLRSIPLGGGALDVGNLQVGQALSFLYGAKIRQWPHFDHGLYSRANPRMVSGSLLMASVLRSADSSRCTRFKQGAC